ncbi:DUF397 domain-containing protein [Streptomyces xiaopingdaonensis]|uniref:DUF397 domain-containing protein n=1 Tax=Streptomyces xiaopingdaonensis TaxID=1565415 RepID=UPI0002D8982B|nr:DUF397 domain-containing protein [Streptomyces xiaopingdaonensis]
MTTESIRWVKSSYSNNGGACVEWAPGQASENAVPVRDSKTTEGPVLAFPSLSWQRFVRGVADGRFSA